MLKGVLLFTAQATGVELDLASYLTVLLLGLVLSTGSGGIPGGELVVASLFLEAFHLPVEIAGIVGGIDRLVDRAGTTASAPS